MSSDLLLSIVIPTHNRAGILRSALHALFRQRSMSGRYEIIVVDDGSEDETRTVVATMRASAPMPIVYQHQPAQGPAAARNHGLRRAAGDLVLFLGDDIIAQPDLVAEHAGWHHRFPDPSVGVLGFVTWSPALTVTPYMRWLEASGNQFDFERIRGVQDVDPARYMYTANLSLKRRFLIEADGLFDERFKHALLEDIDLGRRLAARGFRLKYNPAAVGHHDHAVTLAGYVRRIELSSEYWVLLERKAAATTACRDGPQTHGSTVPRRDYAAYAGYLARVCGEVARTWPFWWMARFCERRRAVPGIFARAHHHWAQRGLLRLEAKRARAKFRALTGRQTPGASSRVA
jgi:glycosyltransferase involved in cell wall biosynthesis